MPTRSCALAAALTAAFIAATASPAQNPVPSAPTAPAADAGSRPVAVDFAGDVDFLLRELPRLHPAPFAVVSEEEWRREGAALKARLASLDPERATVALRSFVARIGDGHTVLAADGRSRTPLVYRLPAALTKVAEGFVFRALPAEHAAFLGRPVRAVNDVAWDDAAKRLAGTFAAENDSWAAELLAEAILDRATLRAVGLADDGGLTKFTLDGADGRPASFSLAPPRDNEAAKKIRFARRPDFPDLRESLSPRRPTYGRRPVAEARALYVWYDACREDPRLPLGPFLAETLADFTAGTTASPPAYERLVLDLRRNSGGDSRLLEPLIDGLARDAATAPPGRLRVLVGRRTFSSAVLNASALKTRAKAALYGEPTGGALNHCGEIKTLRLPGTGLVLQHSTKIFRLVDGPGRTLEPDRLLIPDAAAFGAGLDPVYEAALRRE
jgi:hypothetical protein